MGFCSKCGQELAQGVKFCTRCGRKVESVPLCEPQNTVYEKKETTEQKNAFGGSVPMIKINSNPYKQEIEYEIFDQGVGDWVDVGLHTPNGRLREEHFRKCFLPFYVKDILNILVEEYYLEENGSIRLLFEGTQEEYNEVLNVAMEESFKGKIEVIRSKNILENGKFILTDSKEIFSDIKPVIEEIAKDELEITKNMAKVADALDDIIPICVFGNYSSGKSTFINALIGQEVLPNGAEPVTAKAFKIQNLSQRDVARIKFKHWGEVVELSFENGGFRLMKGNAEDEMLRELDSNLKEMEETTVSQLVSESLKFINDYEKRDLGSLEIGSIIELYVPFSKTGILGSSGNKFVIFDTPGSNTATNDDHIEVLKEALEGFSNGIPIWVSQYETIDTMDNEALCDNILSIDALDQRFTMIVLNKADNSNLPNKGFSAKQIKNIKEYKSVEKMYASGIFFVSSIMGLGAKNNGKLRDEHYRRTYKFLKNGFTDSEDEDYMTLYKYNILPLKMKEETNDYATNEHGLVYVNSGIHAVEQGIEDFASKYASYNKSQMVYMLLKDVVDKTKEKISRRIETRKKLRDKYMGDLDDKKQQLIHEMHAKSVELDEKFSSEAYKGINKYASEHLDYDYSNAELELLNEKYVEENTGQYHLDDTKKVLEENVENLKGRVKNFSFSDLKGSIAGLAEDAKRIYSSKKELTSTKKGASQETVDEVLGEVIDNYKRSMDDAVKKINQIACDYWKNNSKILKDQLIELVTLNDALTDKQREKLSRLIFNYEPLSYEAQSSEVFVKPKFLYGRLLGLDLFVFEKLNTNKLAKEYNKTVEKDIETISTIMNENYYRSYQKWQEDLIAVIKMNIVELNPELQVIADSIDNENEKINHLETSQQRIRDSLNQIETLLSFKVVD